MPRDAATATRREALRVAGLLALGAAAPLVGCTGGADEPAPSDPPGPTSSPDPDAPLRSAAARSEESLLALHDATTTRHPGLVAVLAPLAEHHRRHAAALAGTPDAAPDTGQAPLTPDPTPAPASGSPSPSTPAVPDDPAAALEAVRAAEAEAAVERLRDCLASEDPDLAALLASTGAAESAHAALLGGAA